MKRIATYILISVFISILGCKSTENAPNEEKQAFSGNTNKYERIDQLISTKTDILIQFKSIASFYYNFLFNDYSLFGIELGNEELENMKKSTKFNILSIKELEEHGFDTTIPIGMGFIDFSFGSQNNNVKHDNKLVIFFPAKDSGKILDWLLEMNDITMEQVENLEGENIFFFKGKNSQYFGLRRTANYLILAVDLTPIPLSFRGEDGIAQIKQSFINTLSPQAVLTTDKYYKDVAKNLKISNVNKDAFFYINMQTLFTRLAETESITGPPRLFFDLFTGMQGLGYTADYSGSDLIIDSVMNVEPDSFYSSMYTDVTADKDIIFCLKEKPVLLATSALNVKAFYELIMKKLEEAGIVKAEELREKILDLNQKLEMDIEKDIIANFAGSINFAIAPLHEQAKFPQAILTFNLRDPDKFKTILAKIEPLLLSAFAALGGRIEKETIAGEEVTKIQTENFNLYLGIAKNNLIISLGRDIYEQAATGSVDKGFLKLITESEIKSHLKKDLSCVYLDFQAGLELVNNIPVLNDLLIKTGEKGEQIRNFLGMIEYLFSYSNFSGQGVNGTLKIKTSFSKSFMQSLIEFIKMIFRFDKGKLAPPDIT
jgi:hypothetical protein